MKSPGTWLKKTIFVLTLSLGLAVPLLSGTASAGLFSGSKGAACDAVEAADASGHCDPKKLEQGQDDLTKTIAKLLNLLTMVVGIMTVIMLIISGIRFVTGNGNSESISSAKNTLIYALVGLIIVAFAQAIVKLVLDRIN